MYLVKVIIILGKAFENVNFYENLYLKSIKIFSKAEKTPQIKSRKCKNATKNIISMDINREKYTKKQNKKQLFKEFGSSNSIQSLLKQSKALDISAAEV